MLSACSNFNPDGEVILNVDNEFEIAIKEVLAPDVRAVEFTITSLDRQDCQEATLALSQKTTLNSLNIDIEDIVIPVSCGPKGTYPEGIALFNIAERLYQLEVNVKDIVNHKGVLEVNADFYTLGLSNKKGLIPTTDFLFRIPDDFIWGYYQFENEAEEDLFERLFEENDLIVKQMTHMSPGHYSYFDIDIQGNLILADAPSNASSKPFAFDNIDIETIKESVNRFKVEYPNASIEMFASDGSSF